TGRTHDRRHRRAARTQLQRRLDDDAVGVRIPDTRIDPLDRNVAAGRHSGVVASCGVMSESIIPAERIEHAILILRRHKVILDASLAALYGVATKALVRAMKRNTERFPADFMFQLTSDEVERLRYQSGTSNTRGGRRYRPYAFTEQGVAML